MKLPAFQFYPGDWIRDPVSGCSLSAQGLWLRMMILAHDSDRYGYLCYNGAAIPQESIARRCGCNLEQYATLLAELDNAGVPSRTPDGIIYSRRMVRDAKEREGNRKRQTRFRGRNGSVTPHVTPLSEDEVEEIVLPTVRNGKGSGETIEAIRGSLNVMFHRDPQEPWEYVEEHALVQVGKRNNALAELEELKVFRSTGELFPQSIDSLLAGWGKTLDRARNTPVIRKGHQQATTNGADTVKFNSEYERVLNRMKVIRSQYSEHQTWAENDREEWKKLVARKKELKVILGITV